MKAVLVGLFALVSWTTPAVATQNVDVLVSPSFMEIQCAADEIAFTTTQPVQMSWRCINLSARYSCTMSTAAVYGPDLRTTFANCTDLVTPASSLLFKDSFE